MRHQVKNRNSRLLTYTIHSVEDL